ncbi:MAG: D-alanine--D-alanine ligase [Planctomycetes bacterium]|nr:D-alanine--D-alanine ligase [Planctomycetota bacterium]
MRIGVTCDLRPEYLAMGYGEVETAEFDRPETVEAIEEALRSLGHEPDRIGHVRNLVERLARGERWDLVFNIAEGMHGIGREAQVPALLDAYAIPYTFSDPLVMALTLHKGLAKVVARDAGVPTALFHVVADGAEIERVDLPFPLFAKPIAEGTGKGVSAASKVRDRAALAAICKELLATYRQSVLVETFLPGREFTTAILGSGAEAEALGTMEVQLLPGAEPEVYSYANKERSEELCEYRLCSARSDPEARRAEEVALLAWRTLGCRDAGRVDTRSDAHGEPHFLEVNPLAGMHPSHSDLPIIATLAGMPYRTLIERIVASAAKRSESSPPPPPLREPRHAPGATSANPSRTP